MVWVVILFAARGEAPFKELGVGLGAVIGLYLCAGLAGGAIVGLLRPLTVTALGSMFVGWLVALVAASGAAFLLASSSGWDSGYIVVALVYASIVGPICGRIQWKRAQRSQDGPADA